MRAGRFANAFWRCPQLLSSDDWSLVSLVGRPTRVQGMKAMASQRSHSIEFKRQVAEEFIAGESTRVPQSISLSRQER
jgi:hypothetical protein